MYRIGTLERSQYPAPPTEIKKKKSCRPSGVFKKPSKELFSGKSFDKNWEKTFSKGAIPLKEKRHVNRIKKLMRIK